MGRYSEPNPKRNMCIMIVRTLRSGNLRKRQKVYEILVNMKKLHTHDRESRKIYYNVPEVSRG